jgi:hypothetical protein
MASNERHDLRGVLTVELRDPDGCVVDRRVIKNLITDGGRAAVARLFSAEVPTTPELFIAVGTGTAAAATSDTSVVEVARGAATTAASKNVATVQAVFPATGAGATQPLTEAGIILRLPGAPKNEEVLYNRVTFDVVNKAANMEMSLSWEVIF